MPEANSTKLTRAEAATVGRAAGILKRRLLKNGANLSSPTAVRNYLAMQYGQLQVEVFSAIWLDAQNRVLAIEEISKGTLTQTSVFPREVVRSAIHYNAAGVIFAHNHPSGTMEPSHADQTLTYTLSEVLALIDVSVLDHFVVGGHTALSFSERGISLRRPVEPTPAKKRAPRQKPRSKS